MMSVPLVSVFGLHLALVATAQGAPALPISSWSPVSCLQGSFCQLHRLRAHGSLCADWNVWHAGTFWQECNHPQEGIFTRESWLSPGGQDPCRQCDPQWIWDWPRREAEDRFKNLHGAARKDSVGSTKYAWGVSCHCCKALSQADYALLTRYGWKHLLAIFNPYRSCLLQSCFLSLFCLECLVQRKLKKSRKTQI